MSERAESAAERLAFACRYYDLGEFEDDNPSEDRDAAICIHHLANSIPQSEAFDPEHRADRLVRILLSWSVAPAIREAVREIEGRMCACRATPPAPRRDRERGYASALNVLKRHLEPLGLWPGEDGS